MSKPPNRRTRRRGGDARRRRSILRTSRCPASTACKSPAHPLARRKTAATPSSPDRQCHGRRAPGPLNAGTNAWSASRSIRASAERIVCIAGQEDVARQRRLRRIFPVGRCLLPPVGDAKGRKTTMIGGDQDGGDRRRGRAQARSDENRGDPIVAGTALEWYDFFARAPTPLSSAGSSSPALMRLPASWWRWPVRPAYFFRPFRRAYFRNVWLCGRKRAPF